MNSSVYFTAFTLVVVCACLAQQAEAGWRDRYDISGITRNNPAVKTILDGPLGSIIDIVVEIVLFLLDFILGGAFAPIAKFNKLEREVASLHAAMEGRGGSNPGVL